MDGIGVEYNMSIQWMTENKMIGHKEYHPA